MTVSKVRTSAGTKFYASVVAPATYDKTGFGAISAGTGAAGFTEVGEITDLGSFGKKYNLVSFTPVGGRGVVKRRGSYNNGTMQLKLGSNVTDPGQLILQAAGDASLSFKVVTQSGSTYYFTGQVMGTTLDIGSVDTITGMTCDIEIDNDIITDTLTA